MMKLSHSSWVRGLKQINLFSQILGTLSHSSWVRGLKHFNCAHTCKLTTSHSSWVRGLKLTSISFLFITVSRTPRECVDWNKNEEDRKQIRIVALLVSAWIETNILFYSYFDLYVALLVSAWIETFEIRQSSIHGQSHSSWVRGLKQAIQLIKEYSEKSHSSWVRGLKQFCLTVYQSSCPSHSSWVRGLKPRTVKIARRERRVALLVSAWIETCLIQLTSFCTWSHSSWVRGLKLKSIAGEFLYIASHSSWVRGLKHWIQGMQPW